MLSRLQADRKSLTVSSLVSPEIKERRYSLSKPHAVEICCWSYLPHRIHCTIQYNSFTILVVIL